MIERGQLWYLKPSPGAIWATKEPVRVMTVVDGYVVHRFKGCMPGLTPVNEFTTKYEQRDDNARG